MRRFAAFMAALALTAAAIAQEYPNRPIKILQGFAPGGNADAIARILAAEMSKGLGQPIVVEAKPGAGGNLAAEAVAKAPPDGHLLLLATGGHAVSGAIYKSLSYPSVDGFEWISTATLFPFMLSVRSDGKFASLADVLAAVRAKPESVTYGTAGVGATQHLTGELLASMAGVRFLHVPYKGDAGALTALLAGDVNFIITPATAPLPHIKSGKLKAIAVTRNVRWSGMPEVPTVDEGGVKGFDVGSWAGLAAPASTPRPIGQRLHAEMQRALQSSDVRAKLEGFGGEVRGSTSAELRARVSAEVERWARVIRDANIEQQ
jgi:tripartite-type tricarboxylate transporter receptor subunit TctC